jgi:hypothetical protein
MARQQGYHPLRYENFQKNSQRGEVNVLSPDMKAGLIVYLVVLILAGNFVLCTLCCPFFSRVKRRNLRAIFGVSLIGVVGLAYFLFDNLTV